MELVTHILLALLVGVIMNFAPCVAPVLALKLRALGDSKAPYVAGVLTSFMALATCSVVLGTGLSQMGFEPFRMALVVVCSLMAAQLWGVWELPSFGYRGTLGPFAQGCLTTALGTACSVPFLAPVMVYTLSCGVLETYLLFGAMGLGFCSPFIVPLPLKGIGRVFQGVWFERTCGVIMLVIAAWLASTLSVPYFLASLTMVLGFLFIYAKLFVNDTGIKQAGYLMVFLSLMMLLTVPFLPNETDEVDGATWTTEGPRMIFVTADWCINCKAVYPTLLNIDVGLAYREAGIDEIEVLDFTDRDPGIWELLVRLGGSPSVPLLWIVTDTKETVLMGLWTKKQVLQALEPPS